MNDIEELLTVLKNKFGEEIYEVKTPKPRRVYMEVKTESLRKILSYLKNDLGFDHISTITGLDSGQFIELIYHIVYEDSLVLSIKIKIPRNDPRIHTVSDIYPSAELYEREIYDLLGVLFDGHPENTRLILPEDWPKGLYPLRKDITLKQISSILDKGGVKEE
ncbi:MAG: NADH-quinone oxidoreductase subunit C [Candidatus Caldarchaeales archaeon]